MTSTSSPLRLALPKGRMQEDLLRLLGEAGVHLQLGSRNYRPTISLEGVETKLLKPQNVVEMLHVGSRDIGFAGADWVAELDAELVQVLDLGLNPVRVVAAAPTSILTDGALPKGRHLLVASEYQRLTRAWIARMALDAQLVRTYGATEVFPPEDADCIVDNTSTGSTLRANGLEIVDELLRSSTRFYAHPRALDDPHKRAMIEDLELVMRAVLEARARVMVELNVAADRLDQVIAVLPCMREPTISSLHASQGYALKAAVPRAALATLIPKLKAAGGSDIIVMSLSQIVP